MEILLLILLMVVAGVLFLPEFLKERSLDSPAHTVSDFRRGMSALAWSTHNNDKRNEGIYTMSASGSEPEPYIRRSRYDDGQIESTEEVIPYPRNRARAEMQHRRQRVAISLWAVVILTGILALIPSIRWMLPVHLSLLLLLAGYTILVMMAPERGSRR